MKNSERPGGATTVPSGPHPVPDEALLVDLPLVVVADAPAPKADFELGDVIGTGGMGRIVSARQRVLDRTVALKFLRHADQGASTLLREAIVTGRLEHPNIVPVHLLASTAGGDPFFAMKRIEGTPWSQALSAGQPLIEALDVLLKVCDAVSFAHARGVLHRDIKPDNVLVGSFGEVYLVDWGLAVSLVPDGVLTPVAQADVSGTPAYMAPEMARGDNAALGPASDVYLLGATLYEVLTGRLPHRAATPQAVMGEAVKGLTPVFDEPVPPELASICRKAMAKEPADRYPSVASFRAAVKDHLRHREAYALFEQAHFRLTQLEQLAKHHEPKRSVLGLSAHTTFSECRFGFEQVRRVWPEFEPARDGLERACLLMAWHEVQHEDPRAARILVAQLRSVPEALIAAIEQAETQQYQREARLYELERDARDHAIDVVLREKRVFSFVFGLMVFLGSVIVQGLIEAGLLAPTTRFGLLLFGVPVITSELFSLIVRRARQLNVAQRRIVQGLRVSAWCSVALWTTAWALDLPPTTALVFAYLVTSANWFVSAALFHRRGVTVGAALLMATVLSIAFPRFAFVIGGAWAFAGFTAMSWWLRERTAERALPER